MKILVVGSGGREHALVWKLRQSAQVTRIWCAPGNAGTALDAENVAIASDDISRLLKFARDNSVDLTVVGPEAPLVAGIVDEFRRQGLVIFGPTAAAARLEGSKVFTKKLLRRASIPTADFAVFNRADDALRYIEEGEEQPHPEAERRGEARGGEDAVVRGDPEDGIGVAARGGEQIGRAHV